MLISQCHFDGPSLKFMGPMLGPLKPTVFLKPMGPLKSMGPGVIVAPDPPLDAPDCKQNVKKLLHFCNSHSLVYCGKVVVKTK